MWPPKKKGPRDGGPAFDDCFFIGNWGVGAKSKAAPLGGKIVPKSDQWFWLDWGLGGGLSSYPCLIFIRFGLYAWSTHGGYNCIIRS